jgi:anhydro-N-acetylmuramic acid kinase
MKRSVKWSERKPARKSAKQSGASRLVIGLMSGTSADGIDVALVRIADNESHADRNASVTANAQLENFVTLPFPAAIRATTLRLAEGAPTSCAEISQMNFRLGELFAQAILQACRKFHVSPSRISLIGSHGQTIYHQGVPGKFLGAPIASTLQIGEPSIIAARTGITTVGDFRPADIAAGGQGAPLVPFVDYLLYRDAKRGRAALNIGGIANVTVIPANARPQDVFAFDTGPGNMVMDALMRKFTRGKRNYDRDAQWAMRGKLLPELLTRLLAEPYFQLPPPKTAGREQFGEAYVEKFIALALDWARAQARRPAKPEDLVRTATIVTALSVVEAVNRWVLPRAAIHQLIVSGGGARNPLLMAQLAAALTGIEVIPSETLGVPGDAKEAFAFALLANETVHGRPANLPSATGAQCPAILGKICLPPPR